MTTINEILIKELIGEIVSYTNKRDGYSFLTFCKQTYQYFLCWYPRQPYLFSYTIIGYDKCMIPEEVKPYIQKLKIKKLPDNIYEDLPKFENLRYIEFYCWFNDPINRDLFSKNVEHIKFGYMYIRDVNKYTFPYDIKIIEFGMVFDKEINKGVIPYGTQRIIFRGSYKVQFKPEVFPNTLKELILDKYNLEIKDDVLPDSIELIDFGKHYNQKLPKLPKSIKKIILPHDYKYDITNLKNIVVIKKN